MIGNIFGLPALRLLPTMIRCTWPRVSPCPTCGCFFENLQCIGSAILRDDDSRVSHESCSADTIRRWPLERVSTGSSGGIMRAKVFIAFLIAWLALVQAAAQAGPPSHSILSDPDKFADAHVNGLDAQLHLSEQQKAQLHPLFVAEGKKLISILNDGSLSEEQRGQKIQQLHEQTAAKVATFLTPSQLKQYSNRPGTAPPRRRKGPQQI